MDHIHVRVPIGHLPTLRRCIRPHHLLQDRAVYQRFSGDLAMAARGCKCHCERGHRAADTRLAHDEREDGECSPMLRLYEDVLSNGAVASLPAAPRMIFVIHGAVTVGDRRLRGRRNLERRRPIALTAGPGRRHAVALGNGSAAAAARGAARNGVVIARKAFRAARHPAARASCCCAATASPSRPAAAPISTGIRVRASAACSKAASASTPTAARRPTVPAAPGTRPARTPSSPRAPTGRRASSAS